jgi:hypothetical protein
MKSWKACTWAIMLGLLLLPLAGCDRGKGGQDKGGPAGGQPGGANLPQGFDASLSAVTTQANTMVNGKRGIDGPLARHLDSYLDPAAANIDSAEMHRRLDATVNAIIATDHMAWMRHFLKLKLPGEYSNYHAKLAWGFMGAHTGKFFSGIDVEDDFGFELGNPNMAFSSDLQVRACLANLDVYISQSQDPERKRIAQNWRGSLEELLRPGGASRGR